MGHADSPDPEALEDYREYLRFLARLHVPPRLQSKVGASDIVQQTLLQATQKFGQFRGRDATELAAWLRRILSNVLIDAVRAFDGDKRDVGMERSLEATLNQSSRGWRHSFARTRARPASRSYATRTFYNCPGHWLNYPKINSRPLNCTTYKAVRSPKWRKRWNAASVRLQVWFDGDCRSSANS